MNRINFKSVTPSARASSTLVILSEQRAVCAASRRTPILATLLLLALLPGCNVRKQQEGANKKVDIQTPFGSLHVNTDVDPRDTGLEVYPGATRAKDEDSQHAANLSVSSSLFGAKLVAVKYRSDDPPEKLLDFYRKQLKSFGDFSECRGSATFMHGKMFCQPNSSGETELVAGTENWHHIVAVRPEGQGTLFGLVYVQAHGEKDTM